MEWVQQRKESTGKNKKDQRPIRYSLRAGINHETLREY